MLNLAVILEHSAREHPERTAVVLGDTRLTYAQVDAAASQLAHLLRDSGIEPGDHVALSCPNLPYFPIAYFGILKAGAVVVPLNVLLQAREIAYHLQDVEAKAYFCFAGTPELPMGERGREAFEVSDTTRLFFSLPTPEAAEKPTSFPSVATAADDTAVILYTSGTTGEPKGAELTHQNMLLNAIVSDEMFERHDPEVALVALPLFHSFGQTTVMNEGFRRGATLVLMPRFEPVQALELMHRENVTHFAGVPTMYWAMLEAIHAGKAEPPTTLGTAVSGGGPLPHKVLADFDRTFGFEILEGYGLSETSPVATFNRLDRPRKPGTIGLPIWGTECRLVDEQWNTVTPGPAELAVRGHAVMKGYYRRPEETARVLRDGWLRTGDIATVDSDGYYTIVDRAKDLVIRGGFNVYPREVEEVLITHPEVSLVAVVGISDERLGEEVKAYVVRTAGSTLTEDELIAWARDRLAAHKYPRQVEFRDALPMTATGKILKREL